MAMPGLPEILIILMLLLILVWIVVVIKIIISSLSASRKVAWILCSIVVLFIAIQFILFVMGILMR
ncbi:MAG TPA: hypothetical protein PLZ38_05350 [Spirochaetota bacterium]|nr:hypothetical protein [Spirochaetota bacterium]HOM86712.1 hypothetical protein [Spirochaetota bacterium]HOR93375.1 hypothetical protein [Spirochaetota bacterium]HOT19820.1 hypothetical protein [Spirochaetota bacterium]HPD05815.1 hypothetical protein [Spirochaetota bacterium]